MSFRITLAPVLNYPHFYDILIFCINRADALNFLESVATKQVFKPWEVEDELPRLKYELATLSETTLILELLHKAAYRSGLGYSLFSPDHLVGKASPETVCILFINALL